MSKNSINTIISDQSKKQIDALYKKISVDDEFEVMFYNYKLDENRMGLENFLKVLEFLNHYAKAKKLETEHITTLDVIYSGKKNKDTYRVTVTGIEAINTYMEMLHQRQNHVIFSALTGIKDKEKDKPIEIIKKMRNNDNHVDVNDYNIRFRLCKEQTVTKADIDKLKKIKETERDKITFRYKNRHSVILESNKDYELKIDLTNVKMSNNINNLDPSVPIYELEIDLFAKTSKVGNHLDKIYQHISILLKVLQQSNTIISVPEEEEVRNLYADLFGVEKKGINGLDVRKAVSLEVQHVVDKLPNKYAVSDKADGERYLLIIHKNRVYLTSDYLNVKNTGIEIPSSKSKYNNTVLDGEYVFIKSQNRYLYLPFDCLFKGGEDVRQNAKFMERLEAVDEVIENCFVTKNSKYHKIKLFDGKYDIDKIVDYYNKEIKKHMDSLNHDLGVDKQYPLVRRKLFIPSIGGHGSEIFRYSDLMWKNYVYNTEVNCPYVLDGLIYHPLDQKYVTSIRESKLSEYKWKSPERNSIDFYVVFERSTDTNNVLVLYDNSVDEYVKGKAYKVAHLHVGRLGRISEQPTLFQRETNKYICHLFLRDGDVRDEEGNIIQDKTVVEFYYQNDPDIPEKHRWMPIRTRYDKTESVQRYGKKFGNYYDVANRIWRSIINPVLMADLSTLGNKELFDRQIDVMRNKIDHTIIMSEQQENKYYQKITNLAKPMRNFHNWIKSTLVYTFFNKQYTTEKTIKVLDMACGRGGDIMRFYYTESDLVVGFDVSNQDIISPTNGAISRYNQLRKGKPNFPRMYFINADATTPLYFEAQSKVITGMSRQNEAFMKKFFDKDPKKRTMFDRINLQFAIHYFFVNETSLNNFLENINMYLKPSGYIIITCFDADKVLEVLGDKERYTVKYTSGEGEEDILLEIVKKFDSVDKNGLIGPGYPIDVYNSLVSFDNEYNTEYLVHKDYLVKTFYEKCNLELVDTDMFGNQFVVHSNYFKNYAEYESNPKTRKFLMDAAEFYNAKDEVNKASFKFSSLNRYYVFRKMDSESKQQSKFEPKVRSESESGSESGSKSGSESGSESEPESKPAAKPAAKPKAKSAAKPKAKPKAKSKGRGKKQKGGNLEYQQYPFTKAETYLDPNKFVVRDIGGESSFLNSLHDVLVNDMVIPQSVPVMEFYKDIGFDVVEDGSLTDSSIKRLCGDLTVGHELTYTDKTPDTVLDGINVVVIRQDGGDSCSPGQTGGESTIPDDPDVDIKAYGRTGNVNIKKPTIMVYQEGDIYSPIYMTEGDKLVGLQNSSKRFIKNLVRDSNAKLVTDRKKK